MTLRDTLVLTCDCVCVTGLLVLVVLVLLVFSCFQDPPVCWKPGSLYPGRCGALDEGSSGSGQVSL